MSFDLHVPESRSLKAKRAAIRPIVDGLRHRFRVSVAEVDHQDQWQRAEIAVAVVAESDGRVQHLLDAVERFVAAAPDVELLGHRDEPGWRPRDPSAASRAAYPRMARVNEVVREALADELERLSDPASGSSRSPASTSAPTCDRRPSTIPRSAERRSGVTGVVPELAPEQRVTTQAALQAAAPHLRADARSPGAAEVHARS